LFKKIRLKCKKLTDDNDGCQVMTIPHMTLRVRRVKKKLIHKYQKSAFGLKLFYFLPYIGRKFTNVSIIGKNNYM
jgi:hypothetical protein